ncbi:MAG: non-canonical purine NTP pyrophosphatase [Patescibacteria group bacterium]
MDLGLGFIDIEETGTTLEENARLKARGFYDAAKRGGITDVAVLADDGGLEIDALGGEPGIHAKRWAGENPTDDEIIAYTMKRMEGIPLEKRTARFSVFQVLIFPDGTERVVTAATEGLITEKPIKNKYPGLSYGALLVVSKFGKVYDELTQEEQAYTHRLIALSQIRDIIQQHSNDYA